MILTGSCWQESLCSETEEKAAVADVKQ